MIECNHVDCCRNEPEQMEFYQLTATSHAASYCFRHDPTKDPEVAGLWRKVV